MRFHRVRRLCITALLATGAVHGVAGEGDKAGNDTAPIEKVRSALERPDLGLMVESVEASDVPGLYKVQLVNGPVAYATTSGYFIVGDLRKMTTEGFVNITEKSREGKRVNLIADVADKDMIIFSPEGETRAHVNVFTDVTCFYCQKLHREVPQLNAMGIEVRYLAYPRGGPGSDGHRKLVTAWCAEDRQDVLTKLKAKQSVPQQSCENNPVDEQFSLGRQVGVNGTPAIVTADGQLIPGYQPADQLAATLGLK